MYFSVLLVRIELESKPQARPGRASKVSKFSLYYGPNVHISGTFSVYL